MTVLPSLGVTPDEKRCALEHVLKSQTFSRSDQLKRFLQYICEKDIEGKPEEINEYSIAVEALGRPPDYSPADDSSVRTRAHALRQKLQEYYEAEAPQAEIRIEVPKGGYVPHFSNQASAPHPPLEMPFQASLVLPEPRRKGSRKLFVLGVALGAAVVLISLLLLPGAFGRSRRIDPILREAWGPLLNPGAEVEVCIGSPPAMLLHSYKDGQLPNPPMVLFPAPKQVSSWYDRLQMLDGGGKLYMETTQDVFLFGDSLAATSAVQLLSRAGAQPHVIPEANLRVFALRGQNVVLIGSPNYSPLAARFLMSTPFSVHYDPIRRQEVVSDGIPGQGAKRIFRPASDALGMLTKAYGLVTVLPSETGGEGGARTIIFSGITSAGPQAALEFFRSPASLRILKAKLRKAGYSKFPQAYQVVVRCGLDHNLALNWEYETAQVIHGSPLLN